MPGFYHRSKDKEVWVNISNRTVVRVLFLIGVALLLIVALRKISHAIFLIFTAFFLALALNAPVHWLERHMPGKKKDRRLIATTISFFLVVILLAGFVVAITPPVTRSVTTLVKDVPHLVQEARNKNSTIGHFISKYNLQGNIDTFSKDLSKKLNNIPATAVSAAGKLASKAFAILAILALTFMMLLEGPRWVKRFGELVPDEHTLHVNRLASDMYKVIKGYVNGQVILAVLAALLITPALFILHISSPLALMVVVFICGLIPLVGHTIGAIIVSIVALFHSPWSALIILIYYILYQQLENYVIQPRIQASTTNLSAFLVFAAVIVGASFGGLFGGLVAIPLMGCLRVLTVDYLKGHGALDFIDPTKEIPES